MPEFLRKVIIQINKYLHYWPLSICPALVITATDSRVRRHTPVLMKSAANQLNQRCARRGPRKYSLVDNKICIHT